SISVYAPRTSDSSHPRRSYEGCRIYDFLSDAATARDRRTGQPDGPRVGVEPRIATAFTSRFTSAASAGSGPSTLRPSTVRKLIVSAAMRSHWDRTISALRT